MTEFESYVHEQRAALMRFATVLTGQTWLADDLVSDVLGRAYERWDRISQVDRPHAYLRRMIVNDYISWTRRRTRSQPRAEIDAAVVDDTSGPHAERDAMIRLLADLPRRQRAAVVLRYYAGLSDNEIADHLSCRESTVRSQIARALRSLRLDLTTSVPIYLEST